MELDIAVRGGDPQRLDQCFTPDEIALECVDMMCNQLQVALSKFDAIFEPSCGNGAFVRAIKVHLGAHVDILDWCDIDSVDPQKRRDYLQFCPANVSNRLIVGNPPFGRAGKLAIAFFNHAALHASVIAFILPVACARPRQVNKLDSRFHCVVDRDIAPRKIAYSKGNTRALCACKWQVWCRGDKLFELFAQPVKALRSPIQELTETDDFEFVSAKHKNSAHIGIRLRGKNAGKLLPVHAPDIKMYLRVKDASQMESVIARLKTANVQQHGTLILFVGRHDVCVAYNNCRAK